MKRPLFFLFLLSVFFAGCGEPDYSAVDGADLSLDLSSEDLTSEPEIQNPHKEPIQTVMENYERLAGEELGGKDRALIDLSETVGDNALSEHHDGELGTDFTVTTGEEGPPANQDGSGEAKDITHVELRITDKKDPVGPPSQQEGTSPQLTSCFIYRTEGTPVWQSSAGLLPKTTGLIN